MSTFIDPAKIRELADSGDPFWKGAAWILDQQAAQAEAREEALEAGLARMATRVAQRSEFRTVDESRARLNARRANWDDDWSPTPAA